MDHMIEVSIPSFRYEESDLERGYTEGRIMLYPSRFSIGCKLVFKIEVLMSRRKHFVEKRYSEFHALHKKLKKSIKTPEMPSKHVRNWVPKVLEQRRHGLEAYLQKKTGYKCGLLPQKKEILYLRNKRTNCREKLMKKRFYPRLNQQTCQSKGWLHLQQEWNKNVQLRSTYYVLNLVHEV
ncbi:uncharacterized protein [Heptranchias perlo]|uniref:uncharacterized protein isoform X2 n=1 Tax=Heptranchias perlo TaxID=212740 RepID=UPI003559495D